MPEKNFFASWIGLDVSKDTFTAALQTVSEENAIFPGQDSFPISRAGVRQLLKWAHGHTGGVACGIAMESTGRYSGKLAQLILKEAPGQHVSVCNPLAVSRYRSSFTDAKADLHVDPKYIARFACDRQPEAYDPPAQEDAELRELVRERTAIVEACQQFQNRQEDLQSKVARDANRQIVAAFRRKIETLDKAIRALVEKNEEAEREIGLMATVPGVGFLSAATIYAEMGTLSAYTRRQLSALSGVCPVTRQSGTSLRKGAMSHKGSRLLRRILFLDSTQAIARIPSVASLHERLLHRPASSKMTAKCACMRKLLLILRGIVVSGKEYDPQYRPELFTHSQKKSEKSA
jgi:transposase